jgi:glycine/D-amino acid oxidase-like deaminating enzyme
MNGFDIVVVGAGIIGSAAARECARAGLSVAIVEGKVPGGGVTAAGMGHVVVMDDSPAQLALTQFSRSLWAAEHDSLPASTEYESCGTVWVAADDEEMDEVRAKHKLYGTIGVRTEVLDEQGLREAEPNLRKDLAGGLLVPDDSVIYPPAASGHFLAQAMELGVKLFRSRAMSAAQGKVKLQDGTELTAGKIVLAVGAESDLLPALPIVKRKGHLAITDRYPGFVHHQLVELGYLKSAHKVSADSVAFNIQPRQTGQMLIGSSRQYGSTDSRADHKILQQMLERAMLYMPGLANLATIRVWTGFRAAVADKLPLIGPATGLSDDPTIWLNAGFEGLGITNAPGAARLLVDMLLNKPSDIDRTPFLATRMLNPNKEAAHA